MSRQYRVTQEQLSFPDALLASGHEAAPQLPEAGVPVRAHAAGAGDSHPSGRRRGTKGESATVDQKPRRKAARSKATPKTSDPGAGPAVVAAAAEAAGEALEGIPPLPAEVGDLPRAAAEAVRKPESAAAKSGWFGEGRQRLAAHVAAVALSMVAIIALISGSYQFNRTQQAQRESILLTQAVRENDKAARDAEANAKAVELFLRYNELMLQLNSPGFKTAKKDGKSWKEGLAVNLLESLFNLTRGDRDWEATIGWALERHGRFIREQRLSCTAYSSEFVAYLERTLDAQARAFCRDQRAG